MQILKVTGYAAAAAIASFMLVGSAQAAMSPTIQFNDAPTPNFHYADCAVGFHVGPVGTCVVGVDDRPPPAAVVVEPGPRVIERRTTDEDCATQTVKRENGEGGSVTRTRTNCN